MYNNYGFNPYYNQQKFQPMEQITQQYNQPITQYGQQTITTKMGNLLGKSVDNIDVVKAMDIPLDGSVSYFPLTDGSAIVTKKLQSDGTSKIVVYKPIEENEKDDSKNIAMADLEEIMEDIDNLKNDLKSLRKEFKEQLKTKED